MTLVRAMAALFAAALMAGCSVERLPVPSSAPPTRSIGPTQLLEAQPPFVELPAALGRRLLRTVDANGWLVGTLAGGWRAPGIAVHEAVVDDTWGRITATALVGGEIVVSAVDGSAAIRELYRTRDGADGTAKATYTADGTGVVLFSTSLGVRHVHLATGMITQVLPPGRFFDGPKTSGDLIWSPSGRELVFIVCGTETCHSQVAEQLRPKAVVEEFVPAAIAGDWLVGYERPGAGEPLLLDVGTGERQRVAPAIEALWDAMALSDSSFLLWGTSAAGQYVFVLLDAARGIDRLVATDTQLRLPYPGLSTTDWAVVGSSDSVWVEVGRKLDVLDLESGEFFQDVIAVPPAP